VPSTPRRYRSGATVSTATAATAATERQTIPIRPRVASQSTWERGEGHGCMKSAFGASTHTCWPLLCAIEAISTSSAIPGKLGIEAWANQQILFKKSSVLLQRKKWLRRSQTKKRKHAHVLTVVVRDRGDLNAFEDSRQARHWSLRKLTDSIQNSHRFFFAAQEMVAP
jgi:hypothetical protein